MTDAKSWFKAAKDGDAKELAALLEKDKELLNARDEDFKSYSALAHAAGVIAVAPCRLGFKAWLVCCVV
jgi:hypothetical protein